MASHANGIIQPLPAGKQFREFPLYLNYGKVALLPDEHDLIVNVQSGHFILINWNVRYVIGDGQFNPTGELPFVFSLLSAWPSFVPNAVLLQEVTGKARGECVDLIELGGEQALEPLRRFAESCRVQLHSFNIDVEDIGGDGYKLSPWKVARS
jgi:hypothetical protein